jgi:hypothetical protein
VSAHGGGRSKTVSTARTAGHVCPVAFPEFPFPGVRCGGATGQPSPSPNGACPDQEERARRRSHHGGRLPPGVLPLVGWAERWPSAINPQQPTVAGWSTWKVPTELSPRGTFPWEGRSHDGCVTAHQGQSTPPNPEVRGRPPLGGLRRDPCGLRRTMSNRCARPAQPRTTCRLRRLRAVTEYQPPIQDQGSEQLSRVTIKTDQRPD